MEYQFVVVAVVLRQEVLKGGILQMVELELLRPQRGATEVRKGARLGGFMVATVSQASSPVAVVVAALAFSEVVLVVLAAMAGFAFPGNRCHFALQFTRNQQE
ncbi:MAG: hypothetical protein ACQEV6_15145 [Pseudomonadota bacterium]